MESNEIPEIIQRQIDKYQFERLPLEGTFFKSTYRTNENTPEGFPLGTAMIGMYCAHPKSISTFHRLTHDEVWHMYEGDPLELILLYPDGTGKHVCMGGPKGVVQTVIPAGVWQAGRMIPGGIYSIYGTTMAPGFHGTCFEAGIREELLKQYPSFQKEIEELTNSGSDKFLPEGYAQ